MHGKPGVTVLRLFDRSLVPLAGAAIEIPGNWSEGPGLVSRPDKHAIPGVSCDTLPFDVMTAISAVAGSPVDTWNLAHDGADLIVNRSCGEVPLPRVYEGSQIAVAGLPLAVVRNGTRLQFALAAPAGRIARSQYPVTPEMYQAIPYGASMHAGAEVLGADGRPAAFHLDDQRLWPVRLR